MAKKETKHPEEQRLADLMKGIKTKADNADRDMTDAEKKQYGELKRQLGESRFTRLAKKRVNAALKQIRNVGKLAGANYSHTTDQAKRVVDALAKAVETVQAAFAGGKKGEAEFDL